MLNGVVFTSGQEFFETLGMKFEPTDKTYKTGDKKGLAIMKPIVESADDIPHQISYYFDCCMEFLKEEVGEENIVLAQVHYDEDTPHLQAYFLPIVNEVKRKCYEKDSAGNVVKTLVTNKKGEESLVPKLLRDDKGNIIYETFKGNFLNNNQFWKSRGGQHSFSRIQDSFNKFITDKGFNLYRGDVGANKEHKEKLEWAVEELSTELSEKQNELNVINNELQATKETINNVHKDTSTDILNPKKGITGYNAKDVEKIIEYSTDLEKTNAINENEISQKDNLIEKLQTENSSFKNNEEIKKRNKKLIEQDSTIKEQKAEINDLKLEVNSLKNTIDKLKKSLEKWKNKFFEVIDKIFGKELSKYEDDYLDYADDFIDD